LCGSPTVSLALGSGPVVAPTITAAGGFTDYRPVAEIPAQSSVVIVVGP
jgi:hypothetical protein